MSERDPHGLAELQARQRGVVCRRQVIEHGLDDAFVARQLRARRWARVHDGVYVDHTGPLSWEQRAWAAVLAHWPAALSGRSTLRAEGLRCGVDEPLELVVPEDRQITPVPGVRARRLANWDRHVREQADPPRTRLEHAVLTAASCARDDDAAAAVLGEAVQSRRTIPARLADTLRSMPRLRRRRLLTEILSDVAEGACSALERRYRRDVERAHGLPRGTRQRRVVAADGTTSFRDVEYRPYRTLVELDGRLGHDRPADQWRDLERDLRSAAGGDLTLRARWGNVLRACRLAALVARVLQARGWDGEPRPCSSDCPVRISVDH